MLKRAGRTGGVGVSKERRKTVTGIFFGQSELDYMFHTGPTYMTMAPASKLGQDNLIVFRQQGELTPAVRTVVNATTASAGQVNPAMTALGEFLNFATPGIQYVIGDGAVPGTSRYQLIDDTTDATEGSNKRYWADFQTVVDGIVREFGFVNVLIENWYNADEALIPTFRTSFWPMYFGVLPDNVTSHPIDTAYAGRVHNHFLWDATAPIDSNGRGTFDRSRTQWSILGPMPFYQTGQTTEAANFSTPESRRNMEPARLRMERVTNDSLAVSVGAVYGPSSHLCRFGGSSTAIHPDTGTKDGQIGLVWAFAVPLIRAAGFRIEEPTIHSVEVQPDGSYAEVLVNLPNGGNLTTLAALESRAPYAGSSPYQQDVTGFEVARGWRRRPVFKTSDTTSLTRFRGTVTISDTGSGTPRRGRVRLTPTEPFEFGDSLSYTRGDGTTMLQWSRDADLYPYYLLETIPSLRDTSATYPFPGVAVKPFQADLFIPRAAPDFVPRGINLPGSTYFYTETTFVEGSNRGLMSFWFRHTGPTWVSSPSRQLFELRTLSGSAVFGAVTTGSNRITFRIFQTGVGVVGFAVPVNTFQPDIWYHVLWAWDWDTAPKRFQIAVNGALLNTSSYTFTGTGFALSDMARFSLGATGGQSNSFIGDFGHFWLDFQNSLDISIQANREKFILAGQPVDLGPYGELPVGVRPQFYFHGNANNERWTNLGTIGSIPLIGTASNSSTHPGS
jgi:hypothetical protein